MLQLGILHDLLILRITQSNKEEKKFPLARIVGRAGVKWTSEIPVDKGWIDILVPKQKGIERPYVIEVETGYNLDCSQILRKFERFGKAWTKPGSLPVGLSGFLDSIRGIFPKFCVVIPLDFAEFSPIFKAKRISVFLWEGTLEWKCKKCKEITLGSGPRKPMKCNSCNKNEKSLRLVGLADFNLKETDV